LLTHGQSAPTIITIYQIKGRITDDMSAVAV
jgi:hypothetical protein